jgi:RES domain-containing protein
MEVFRITHKKWSDSLTASGLPARWNSSGVFIIYTAGSRALACLENLVHKGSSDFMSPFISMVVSIPDKLKVIAVPIDELPEGWSMSGESGYSRCRPFGDDWVLKSLSAVLKVPSAIIPEEANFLLNPNHPDFSGISIISEAPFFLDNRIMDT